jgi:hypothetical protein
VIRVAAEEQEKTAVANRVRRALESAQKYSLVANSVNSQITIEPTIKVE